MHRKSFKEYSYDFFESLPENMYPMYLRKFYKEINGQILNLKNPKTFTEKIQWLKIYGNFSIKTLLTDKILLRDRVMEIAPELKFPKIFTTANSFDELNFEKCPDTFIIKTNHACLQMIKVTNKKAFLSNKEKLSKYRQVVDTWLSRHFAFNAAFELHYKGISRKVFAEEFINDPHNPNGYRSYRINCFNGIPRFIEYYKNQQVAIYDTQWNKLDFAYRWYPKMESPLVQPKNFTEMLKYAEILSKDFRFVRIDFFEHNEELYLSEMTFTPVKPPIFGPSLKLVS